MNSEESGSQEEHTERSREPTPAEPPAKSNFFAQLRERNVIKVAVGYIVGAWALMQVAELIFSALGYPEWTVKLTVVVLIIGAPIAVIGAWIYEITPRGISRDKRDLSHIPRLSNRQRAVDLSVIGLLVAVAGFIAYTSIPRLLERESQVVSTDAEDSFLEFDLNSIAVLAFENRSSDPEVEYFGDGLSEEILNVLAKLKEFKVAARTASFYYKGKDDVTLKEMARSMQVKHILTGSVRRAGNQIRISAELMDAETGFQIWTDTYDRQFEDIFEIQREIALAVAEQSKVILSSASEDLLLQRPTKNLAAYDLYLQGRDYLRRPRSVSILETAATLFRKALALDEDYALALAGLCETDLNLYSLTKSTDRVGDAEASCAAALAKDDGLSAVHGALGELYRQTGNPQAAEVQFRTALNTDPRSVEALEGLANTLIDLNQLDDAQLIMERMIELQPGYWRGYTVMGNFLYRQGRDEEAIPYFRRVTDLTPDNALGWNSLGAAQYMVGNLEGAATAWRRALDIAPSQHMYGNLGTMYYYLARFDQAEEMQKKAVEQAPDDFRIWGRLAAVYRQQAGKETEAQAAYTRAIELGEGVLEVNPENADALKNVSLFYAQTGNAREALELTEHSLSLTPKDPDTHFFAALVHCALKDNAACLRELSRSVDLGYSVDLIKAEPELADVRHRDEFRLLVSGN